MEDTAYNMEDTAYNWGGGSHGYTISNLPPMADGSPQDAVTTTLPYTNAGGQLECTSCHNVHVETWRPFNQRNGYQAMCEECHAGRNGTAAPAVSRAMAPTGAGRTYSTHPTGVAMDGVATNRTIDDATTMHANMAKEVNAIGAFDYRIGGHLDGITLTGGGAVADGTINCQTCHAVHGPQGVPELATGLPGLDELVAVDNNTTAAPAEQGSGLCEGCHGGFWRGDQVGAVTGAIYEDHPMDNRDALYATASGTLPTSWSGPVATGDRGAQPFVPDAGAGNAGQPACSSCHDTHGGIEDSMILRGPSEGGTLLPADVWGPWVDNTFYDDWCFSCHKPGDIIPDNHHSVINNMNTAAQDNITNPGGGSEFNSQLTCGDCHGGNTTGNWTAHNGFWDFPVAITSTDSAFCEECHYYGDPTIPEDVAQGVAGFPKQVFAVDGAGRISTLPASHGTIRNVGSLLEANPGVTSHQTGIQADSDDGTNPPNINWAPTFSSGGVAQWGAGAAATYDLEPLCESCHNILTNGDGGGAVAPGNTIAGWRANLLLEPYEDDDVGDTGSEVGPTGTSHDFYDDAGALGTGNTGVDFCRACHQGVGAVPVDFVHNPSAHTQDYTSYFYAPQAGLPTAPYGRATTTILTDVAPACPERTTADMAGAPNGLSYPGDIATTNSINCDSCHRPHNADANSWDGGDDVAQPTSAVRGNRFLILEITTDNWGTTICLECHDTDIQCN
jgi:hypothetical protein